MGMFDKFKSIHSSTEKSKLEEPNKNIYAELGIIEPFTLLVGGQFNSFVGELSLNKLGLLNEIEKRAFNVLWNAACIDVHGFGNNIWNLKKGSFEIYNEEGVIVRFEKKISEIKDKHGFEQERANFVYLSKDGSFVINQSDRNKEAFLVYVSIDTTDRLLQVLRNAEAEALHIETENVMSNTTLGIPETISIPSITAETSENIDAQYKIDATKEDDIEMFERQVKRR